MTRLPAYLIPANRATARPPYVATNSLLQTGWIKAKRSALQALLDRSINLVRPGEIRFVSPLASVLYTALHVEEMRSGHPIDRTRGFTVESDIAFWILTYGGRLGHESDWKFRWTPTFMFVNDISAVIGGREVFGFPKAFGSVERRSVADADYGLVVKADALETFGRGQRVKPLGIFEVTSETKPLVQSLSDAEHLWREVARGDTSGPARMNLNDLKPPQLSFPIVLLKQIPSITNADLAVHQSLISVKMESTKIIRTGSVEGRPRIEFFEPASAKIAAYHGIEKVAELRGAFWVRHNFVTNMGAPLA